MAARRGSQAVTGRSLRVCGLANISENSNTHQSNNLFLEVGSSTMVSHFIRLAGYDENEYFESLNLKGIHSDQWRNETHNLFKLPGEQLIITQLGNRS